MPKTRSNRQAEEVSEKEKEEESVKKKIPVIVINRSPDLEGRGSAGAKGHGSQTQRKSTALRPGPKSERKQVEEGQSTTPEPEAPESSSSLCFLCGNGKAAGPDKGISKPLLRPTTEVERGMVKALVFAEDVPVDEGEMKEVCETCGQILSNLRNWRKEVDRLLTKIKKVSVSVKELYRKRMSGSSTEWTSNLRSSFELEEEERAEDEDDPVSVADLDQHVVVKDELEVGSGSDAMECQDSGDGASSDDDDGTDVKEGKRESSSCSPRSGRIRKRPARFGEENVDCKREKLPATDTDSDEEDSKQRVRKSQKNKKTQDFTFESEDEEEEDQEIDNKAKKKHGCSQCSEEFSKLSELRFHLKVVHDYCRKFLCTLCDKEFAGLNYNRHLTWHQKRAKELDKEPPPLVFVCDINDCTATFSNRQEVKDHKRSEHLKVPTLQCYECKKCFYIQRKYDIHMMQHKGLRKAAEKASYICDSCGAVFVSWRNLRVHKLAQHEKQVRFTCVECGKGFFAKYNYQVHLQSHKSKEDKLTCSFCQEKFEKVNERKSHERLIHQGKPVQVCPQCGKECLTTFDLKVHMATHTGDKPFSCEACGERFTRNETKAEHLEKGRCEMGARATHKCSHCYEFFATAARKKNHEWKEHRDDSLRGSVLVQEENGDAEQDNGKARRTSRTAPKRKLQVYMCSLCPKKYTTEARLKYHEKSHTSQLTALAAGKATPEISGDVEGEEFARVIVVDFEGTISSGAKEDVTFNDSMVVGSEVQVTTSEFEREEAND